MSQVQTAIEGKNVQAALDAIPWEEFDELKIDLTPDLRKVLEASAAVAAKYATDILPKGVKIAFDLTNPAAVQWLRDHAADLVEKNIIAQSKDAIKEILLRSFDEGIPPREAARMIKEWVGILPRHARAVENYRQWLIDEKGLLVADADRLAAQYAQKLIKLRAETIARNETMIASKKGQQELWRQAVEKGLLREDAWDRSWLVTPDERLCDICEPMSGARAPLLGGYYVTKDGTVTEFETAHGHIQCRCVETLVKKEKQKEP